MGATVDLVYINTLENVETIKCNFAKVKEGCVVIAYKPKKEDERYVSDYIPISLLSRIRITTDIKDKENYN